MKWISVKDRLPKMEGFGFVPCLMWRSDFKEVVIGMYNTRTKYFQREDFTRQVMITHWMPLPEPPRD